tara:strand:+ start:552 stop:743 length:192 start_codon:yes stop_codon:yes gene_type:complete
MMDVHIAVGEWIHSIQCHMKLAVDDTCFHLPTPMHVHAFWIVKEGYFPEKNFKLVVEKEGALK